MSGWQIFALAWFGAGAVLAPFSFGLIFAHFQRKFPHSAPERRSGDWWMAFTIAVVTLLMPTNFLATILFFTHGQYGLKFR